MFIEDLHRFPKGHPPSPYNFPVPHKKNERLGFGALSPGLVLIAVGWLGRSVPRTGVTPIEYVDILFEANARKLIFIEGMAGWHNCELCAGDQRWYPDGKVGPVVTWQGEQLRVRGQGHHLIRQDNLVYICPALILHYIIDHHYRPPDEFIEAVTNGHFLTQNDLHWEPAPGKAPESITG